MTCSTKQLNGAVKNKVVYEKVATQVLEKELRVINVTECSVGQEYKQC